MAFTPHLGELGQAQATVKRQANTIKPFMIFWMLIRYFLAEPFETENIFDALEYLV